jgi:hypothetical protein
MSNSKRGVFALAIGLLVSLPASATAQWSVEGRVGSAMPSGELTEESGLNQTAGPTFGADATYTFNETFAAYGGLTRQRFNCDGCTRDVSTTGFDGGVKLQFGNDGTATPWVRGGLMLHQPAVDGVSRDWGLGVNSAAGIDWQVDDRISVVPALRLNSYSSGAMSLTYVMIDAGLNVRM